MTEKDIILKNLAKKHGISMKQARDIEDSLRYVVEVMASADRENIVFPSVRIPAFGLFHCPENIKKKIKETRDKFNNLKE